MTTRRRRHSADGSSPREAGFPEKGDFPTGDAAIERGDRRRLMEQASRNAAEALDRRLAESGTQAKILRELTEFLELPDEPARIEVYDNSHISGSNPVGAMISGNEAGCPRIASCCLPGCVAS